MAGTRKAITWAFGEVLIRQLFSLFASLFIARIVGPEAFGLVAMAMVFTTFLDVFEKQGLRQALIQRENLDDTHLNTAFWFSISLGVALWCVAFAARGLVASMFDSEMLEDIIPVVALALPLQQMVIVQQAIIERQLNYKLLTTRTAMAAIVGGIAGIVFALSGFGVWSVVAQLVITRLVAVVTLWTLASWRPGLQWDSTAFRDLWSYGVNLFGSNILEFANQQIDRMVIGVVWGAAALGIYDFAKRIFQAIIELSVMAGTRVSLPILSRLQADPQAFIAELMRFISWTCLLAFPLYAYIMIWAPDVVAVIFGRKWTGSGPLLRILMGMGFIQSVQFYLANSLLALGKPYERFRLTLINTVGNLLVLALTSTLGLLYIAGGMVVRAYAFLPTNVRMLRDFLPKFSMGELLRSLLRPVAHTLLFSMTTYGLIAAGYRVTAFAISTFYLVGYFTWYITTRRAEQADVEHGTRVIVE